MHGEILPDLAAHVRDRATNVAWAQWAALGSGAVSKRAPVSSVDPEALVLSSLWLVGHEPQLERFLAWWAEQGSGLLSVQRMRNLAGRYPAAVAPRLREFGAYAQGAGDHRWKAVSGRTAGGGSRPAEAAGADPRLDGAAATVLRLRLGLGVGIKADLVAALLGSDGWWTVRELALSTAYTARAVRRAVEELARGGWVASSPAAPAEYRARPDRWLGLLGLGSAPVWRDWARLYALVLAVDAWVAEGSWKGLGLAEAEREARRLVDGHRGAFKWAGVAVPAPVSRPGAEYIRAFDDAVRAVTRRMAEGV